MVTSRKYSDEKKDFTQIFEIYDDNHKKIAIELSFHSVKDESNNIEYILHTKALDKNPTKK